MRFRLTYCNAAGNIARLDIITFGDTTATETIEGTSQPFILNYGNDKTNKSGYFRSSTAEINIFETANFNIDSLKTSSETDIKVEWYIDDVLTWTGFVIPDFFSRQIGSPATVSMTASDRLGTLKGVTLSGLSETLTLRSLATQCLQNTGLSLPLNTYAAFTSVEAAENIFDSKVYSQRLNDNKGRSISCYDVLESILVLTNSILIQRFGEWYIYNKIQLESGVGLPELTFDEVSRGAIRSIQPVASSVGVYNEFGGGRLYPRNYNFQEGLTNWSITGGLTVATENRQIKGYSLVGADYVPIYGAATEDTFIGIKDTRSIGKYISSDYIRIPYNTEGEVDISVDITALLPGKGTLLLYAVIAKKDTDLYVLKKSGVFELITGEFALKDLTGSIIADTLVDAVYQTKSVNVKGKIADGNLSDYQISIRLYGGVDTYTTFVTSATIFFTLKTDGAKGNIFKTEQGLNFTKTQEINTSIFGDYIQSGLNGYFYEYQVDDTSSILSSSGSQTKKWTTTTDYEQLPILQHVARQKGRMFSIAHDILRADIDIANFDPLAIFKDCSDKEYTLITASFDFLNSIASVEIEEIIQDLTILKRDYIYSYFGEGESSIQSVGSISVGSSSGSGSGMTSSQLELLNNLASWWKLDDDGNLYSEKNVYSEKEISAFGFSGSGTPIDGVVNLVDLWDVKPITGLTAGQILKYNGTKWVNAEETAGGGVSSWNDLTDKPTTFPPTSHNHAADEITSGIFAIARIPTGSTNTTVALGDHLHTGVYFPNTSFTGANILSKLITVDGHGSDLDADTIDGYHLTKSTNWGKIPIISGDGVIEVGAYIDFHETNEGTTDYDGRLTCALGILKWNGYVIYTSLNFTNLNQLTTRNFNDLQNKPTTLSGFGILSSDTLFDSRFEPKNTNIQDHIYSTSNPHGVTKAQVGLGNVTNESKATMFSNPSFTGTATVQTDIILSSLLSTNKSLKALLDKFDIDTYGNLVVKTNLYSVGEVTAYQSGAGVSGLELQGNLNANNKRITDVLSINVEHLLITGSDVNSGLEWDIDGDTGFIASYSAVTDKYTYANGGMEFSGGVLESTGYKVGDYTLKQEGTDLFFYNGTTKIMKLSAGGNLSLKGTLTQNATL